MTERIQKIISARGIASRRAAEKMIEDGRITVNGLPAAIGQSADPEVDEIRVDGVLLPVSPQKTYIMLNKPKGYVASKSDPHNKTIYDILPLEFKNYYYI